MTAPAWALSYEAVTAAPPEAVWAYYEATDLTPKWDRLVRSIRTQGPIRDGQRGETVSATGFRTTWRTSGVTPNLAYTETHRLPLANLSFTHRLTPLPTGGTRIEHGVACDGLLSQVYRALLSADLRREMPRALQSLAAHAAQGPPQATLGGR